jgi:hypothetical protein
MNRSRNATRSRGPSLKFSIAAMAVLIVLGLASEIEARGGGRGGGMSRGRVSRGGPAQGGSIRHDRTGGGYRTQDRTRTNAQTRTDSNAEWRGRVRKTDDGYVARGVVVGDKGAAAGRVVRDGDSTSVRGVRTDGKNATFGRANCNGSSCYGGRVNVNVNRYYRSPYYYYPYYYGWYSCPYGSAQTWYGSSGAPIYGCSNVTVVHATISLGSDGSNTTTTTTSRAGTTTTTTSTTGGSDDPLEPRYLADGGGTTGSPWPSEAVVSSAPVLMYEVNSQVVAYATTYTPTGVYFEKVGGRNFWLPGPSERSANAKEWLDQAGKMEQPTANATVITYQVGERLVYMTNEHPAPGYFAEQTDQLFAWIPGVRKPSTADRALLEKVIAAQKEGGKEALDREVRKLEKGRDAPPEQVAAED